MKKSKKVALVVLSAAVILAATVVACSSTPKARTLKGTVQSTVLEHKGSALGINELPVWVDAYVQNGMSGVEKLADYDGYYCFVATEQGENLAALQTWVANFDVPREIAAMVSSRVTAVFTGTAAGSPDDEYGRQFTDIVTNTANATYSGARKLNDWWVLMRRPNTDGKKPKYLDRYHVYVLYTIDKATLNKQIAATIKQITDASSATAAQKQKVDAVRTLIENGGL